MAVCERSPARERHGVGARPDRGRLAERWPGEVAKAELFAQFMRAGELMLGIALILGLLTNLAAIGSVGLSAVILLSQGGVGLGTGLGAPEFLTINVLVALFSVVILFSP